MPRRRLAALAAGTTAFAALAAVPSAASNVSVSFTVGANASGLSVSSAAASATVDNSGSNLVFDPAGAGTITDTLPAVTVTDKRGQLAAGWTLSVSGTAFTSGSNSVAASNARVYNDAADVTALTGVLGGALSGMVVTGGEMAVGTSNLGTPYTLLSGTTTLGNGSVTATPTMRVAVPAGTPIGTYTGTVTYTAS
jgi:hypothetical protein